MNCAICMYAWPPVEDMDEAVVVIGGLSLCEDHSGSLAGADENLRPYIRGRKS